MSSRTWQPPFGVSRQTTTPPFRLWARRPSNICLRSLGNQRRREGCKIRLPHRPSCLSQASSRMSEITSLTDAVKLAAGISLTEAVKGVSGRRTWFVEELLDIEHAAAQVGAPHRAMRHLARCARLIALAVLALALPLVGSTILDGDWPAPATTHKRVALVIGNSTYQYTPKLENPKNDAADMSSALRKLGFQVIEGFDLDKAAFDGKIRDFSTSLASAEAGVFFYAGHGLQVSGRNYLVPIDSQLTTVSALEVEMVNL